MTNLKLLMLVLNKIEKFDHLMVELNDAGVHGATAIDSVGMAQSLASLEDSHIIAALRAFMTAGRTENKTIFFVLEDDQVEIVKKVVTRVVGDLSEPNTGIMFSVPIDWVEGYYKKTNK